MSLSFRDRLLCLLDEHEQLERQHEILLEKNRKSSNSSDGSTLATLLEKFRCDAFMLTANGIIGEQKTSDDGTATSDQMLRAPGEQSTVVCLDEYCRDLVLSQHETSSAAENPWELPEFELSDIHPQPDVQEDVPIHRASSAKATRSDILSKMRRQARLQQIFELTESLEEKAQREKELIENMGFWERLKYVESQKLEIFIDSWISVIVLANALFLGLQMDFNKDTGFGPWQAIDCIFTCIFVFEVCLKCWIHGVQSHFCGPDKKLNIFDVFLIVLDVLQLLLSLLELGFLRIPSASLFRIIRLFRIVRLIRLLRTNKFKDLVSMVQGMILGSTTLCWAIVFFGMMVYTVALVCRSSFGSDGIKNVEPYFGSVGVSMYTVYRCSFGDCSSEFGTPISEHIRSEYGGLYALLYAAVSFVFTIGLFNVISAIFVDATMTSAAKNALAEATLRLNDEVRLATNVTLIIRNLLSAMDTDHGLPLYELSTVIPKLKKVEFTRDHVDMVFLEDPAVHDALEALDIDTYDHRRLSDILDPDHGGTIDVLDLMNGLQRLRGSSRRSDVVTVDLMVRKLQESVDHLHHKISKFQTN